ncbi:hypothetical protein [Lactobacillus sp. Sy-1]|uniref:hypothetical protein n=1 Tax=Lactobacillus sp. Sy-1 TaxID=2109645 RepID=UPI001C5B2CA6|nr:hypothetical protein [Lactobacillus sp. Sy-1]MBW1606095.1 hypothetical protein [Lactobacillus sp. Sy-1]
MNIKHVLVASALTLSLSASVLAVNDTQSASASSWHTGLPSFVKKSEAWMSTKKFPNGSVKGWYKHYILYTSTKIKDQNVALAYFGFQKSGKATEMGTVEAVLLKLVYKQIGKNTYQMKDGKYSKDSLHWNYIVKKSGKGFTMKMKGDFTGYKHWKSFGKFVKVPNRNDYPTDPLR